MVHKEYRLRIISASFLFLGLTGLVAFAFLSPSLLAARQKYTLLAQEKEKMERETPELRDIASLQQTVGQTKNKLKIITPSTQIAPTEVIRKISEKKTSSIRIDSLSYVVRNKRETPKEKELEITISGIASTRDSLINFVKILEDEKSFSNVVLPVSDLAKDKNVSFSVNFSAVLL